MTLFGRAHARTAFVSIATETGIADSVMVAGSPMGFSVSGNKSATCVREIPSARSAVAKVDVNTAWKVRYLDGRPGRKLTLMTTVNG
jgi:hypothetical protein